MKRSTNQLHRTPLPALAAALAFAALGAGGCRHAPDAGPGDGGAADAGEVDGGVDGGTGETGNPPGPPVISDNAEGWWRDDVFYEIFVRSFQDSDADGIGDFQGLIERLDYLNDGDPETTDDLGVDAVWLMPIMASPSYHGYDVTDYRAVNPDYGTLEDFDAFVAAAHERGIRVILDFVINHSSSEHPWFQNARTGPDAEYRDWYVWRDENPGWTQPWGTYPTWHGANGAYYYGVFWGGMPDLNWQNPEVMDEMVSSMKFWLDRGVDGFRIDAARYLVETDEGQADLPETHEALQQIRHRVHQSHPEALFVGEVWTDAETVASYYGEGNELQLAFSFDIGGNVLDSLGGGTRSSLNYALHIAEKHMEDRGYEAPFLTNHDMVRVRKQLDGAVEDPDAAMRLGAAALFAMPGTPFLYYGEEIGMQGKPGDDENKRTPMQWTAEEPFHGFTDAASTWYSRRYASGTTELEGVNVEAQQADPDSLWNLYRTLTTIRHDSPALSLGDASRPGVVDGGPGVLALLRDTESERVLVVFNFATESAAPFTVEVDGSPRVLYEEGLTDLPLASGEGLSFSGLLPRGFAYIALD